MRFRWIIKMRTMAGIFPGRMEVIMRLLYSFLILHISVIWLRLILEQHLTGFFVLDLSLIPCKPNDYFIGFFVQLQISRDVNTSTSVAKRWQGAKTMKHLHTQTHMYICKCIYKYIFDELHLVSTYHIVSECFGRPKAAASYVRSPNYVIEKQAFCSTV